MDATAAGAMTSALQEVFHAASPTAVAINTALMIWAWRRQLPWVNVIVLYAGSALGMGLLSGWWCAVATGLPGWSGWIWLGVCLSPSLMISRLIAQDLWEWRAERPRYGYEVMAVTGLLVAWPYALLMEPWRWTFAGAAFALAVVWQVCMTPWLIRKSPAPAPRDWVGPVAWVGWVSMMGCAVLGSSRMDRAQDEWLWLLLALPGLLAFLPWRRINAAKAKPGPA
ncbi:MAG: hypothetical protein N3J91_08205 [Verrucomicrobiae bacterium]|nr:hypothetical protein [Verrucomicrobiae bacterium]